VTFSASATGFPTPAIEWFDSTDGVSFALIAGATSPSLTLTTTAPDDGKRFSAIFWNDFGQVMTGTAKLTVRTAPSVVSGPSDATIAAGQSVSFVAVANGSPAPTVQWQRSLDGATFANIAGATSSTLTFTPGPGASGSYYRAIFSNACGSGVFTAAARLTVHCNEISIAGPSAIAIAGAPYSATFAATGAIGAATFSMSTPPPPGLTFSSNGTLSGTPATSGTFPITVTVSDSYGCSGTLSTSIDIAARPTVTLSPANASACSGSAVSFSASANGFPAPAVQWMTSADGGATFAPIDGATSTTYTFTPSAADNGNRFHAVFTNGAGQATTGDATLDVKVPPVVDTNPSNVTVIAGQPATFTAAASGTPAPTASWQQSTDGGVTFADIPGATAPSLSVTATMETNGLQYRARFSNSCAADVASAPATLNVTCYAVRVTPPPVVIATLNSPYEQPFIAVGVSGTAAFIKSGALPAGLSLSPDGVLSGTPLETGIFPLLVSVHDDNGCGGSVSITLSVFDPPAVTQSPSNATACSGSAMSFTASATGFPTPSVQWMASIDGGSTFAPIDGATSTTYTTTLSAADAGKRIRALFTNAAGDATSGDAVLTVNVAPIVTTDPVDMAIIAGQPATFAALGAGSPFPTVQWQSSTDGVNFDDVAGATASTLTVSTTRSSDGIRYRALFSNACANNVATSAAKLTVSCYAITVAPSTLTLTVGQPFAGSFIATGASISPGFSFTGALPSGVTVAADGTISGTPAQTGNFPIVVSVTDTNGCTGSVTATITVVQAPAVTLNPVSRTLCSGPQVTLTAAASGFPAPAVQWMLSSDGGTSFTAVPGATSATLLVTPSPADDGKQYEAVFTNAAGSATTSIATLTVHTAPSITTNPASVTVAAGASATFTAAASGSPSPSVQWQQSTNGATFTNINGATSTTLTFGTDASKNGYKYRAVFANACAASVTTSAATLTVACDSIVIAPPASLVARATVPYSGVFTVSGATSAVTFTATGLPAGLTLGSDGTLTGTASAVGSYPITVTAAEANGCSGSIGVTLTVPDPFQFVTSGLVTCGGCYKDLYDGSYYGCSTNNPNSTTFCSGGACNFAPTESAISLQSCKALCLNEPGCNYFTSYNFGVCNLHFVRTCTFTSASSVGAVYGLSRINQFTVAAPPAVTGNTAFNVTVTGSPTTSTFYLGTVHFSSTSAGTLPPDYSFKLSDNATRTFSVILVTPGTQTITVRDTADPSIAGSATVTVGANACAMSVSPATINVSANVPFSTTFTAPGAFGATTFTLTGALPAGVTFVNGALSGTAAQGGTYPFSVTATDSLGCTASTAVTLTVIAAPVITSNPVSQTLLAGTQVTMSASANGTPAPTVQWQVSTNGGATYAPINGATSTILTFSAACSGSGNRYRAVFTNSSGSATTSAAVISISPINIAAPSLIVTAGSPYNGVFTASGASGVVTFSASGTLPAGLTFVNGTLSGTTTATGSYPIVVTATDPNGCSGTLQATVSIIAPPSTSSFTFMTGGSVTLTGCYKDLFDGAYYGCNGSNADATFNCGSSCTFTPVDDAITLSQCQTACTNDPNCNYLTWYSFGICNLHLMRSATFTSTQSSGSSIYARVRPTTRFTITAPASVTRGTQFTITVFAVDAASVTNPTYAGTVHFTSSTTGTLPADYTFNGFGYITQDNGKRTFSVTLTTAGTQTITVTDTTTGAITGSVTVNVN
jgi:hypothetical protein